MVKLANQTIIDIEHVFMGLRQVTLGHKYRDTNIGTQVLCVRKACIRITNVQELVVTNDQCLFEVDSEIQAIKALKFGRININYCKPTKLEY